MESGVVPSPGGGSQMGSEKKGGKRRVEWWLEITIERILKRGEKEKQQKKLLCFSEYM